MVEMQIISEILECHIHNGTIAERTSSRLRRTNDRSALSVHEDHEDNENEEIGVPQQFHNKIKYVLSRRDLVKFLGLSAALPLLNSCDNLAEHFSNPENLRITETGLEIKTPLGTFRSLAASTYDDLILPEGYSYDILCSFSDKIASLDTALPQQRISEDLYFGCNNDYVGFLKINDDTALLAVNHEFIDTAEIANEAAQRKAVGMSIIKIVKDNHGLWKRDLDELSQREYNRRIDAETICDVSGPVKQLYNQMIGTLANCSGAVTPWNTVLTCEENYYLFNELYKWSNFDDRQYGWIVEINPFDPESKPVKHTSLGRMAHENCALIKASQERMVVYMGDDKASEYIYKFISSQPLSMKDAAKEKKIDLSLSPFSKGELYVAKLDKNLDYTKQQSGTGKWLKLDFKNPKLRSKFKSEAEMLINTRLAAKLLGATAMDRPESLSISPKDSSIVAALTYNPLRNNHFGSLFRIVEDADHAESMSFTYQNLILGGENSGFACPDNIFFDKNSNLWLATDIGGDNLNKGLYTFQGNNSLFVIPSEGEHAGKALRFASAPLGAEFCGICFDDDYKTLFLSVQHPGEEGTNSQWPDGDTSPKSSLVAIYQETEWW